MTASQISFASFAASLLASFQDEPTDCTPPVDETAAVVVAHSVAVGGGECISFRGAVVPSRLIPSDRYRSEFALVPEHELGCGLDAPDWLPSGSHQSWSPIPSYVKADGYGAHMRGD